MIYEVTTTKQADTDLRRIYEHITFELCSPDNAAGQLGRLEERILELEKFPDKEAGLVTIIRVMYSGRDVDIQLKDHTVI